MTDFVVELPQVVDLAGDWEVALYQADYRFSSNVGSMYVFCDLCEESYIYGQQLPVLHKIKGKNSYVNATPSYVHVKPSQIQRIHVYVTDSKLEPISARATLLECTLVMRRVYK